MSLTIPFFCGCSAQHLGDAAAHGTLQVLIESGNPLYLRESQWTKALLHLRAGEVEAARALLEALAEDREGVHGADALEVLEGL